ncbi:hypothetical protein Tco_0564432 [Tanacetum coccineum]
MITIFHVANNYQSFRPCVKYENVTKVTSCNGMKLREGLFPVDIRRSSSGVKLLGGAVSSDADFISGLVMRRATNAVYLMGLLPQLHDPQSELLLLRSCMGIAKLFFGLRTCQPVHIEEAALFFDKGLRGSIENIVVCGGSFFEDLQWRLASLPIRFGGLGFGICGMDDDYVSALACLRDTIPSFDFSATGQGEDLRAYVLASDHLCSREICEDACKKAQPPNTNLQQAKVKISVLMFLLLTTFVQGRYVKIDAKWLNHRRQS